VSLKTFTDKVKIWYNKGIKRNEKVEDEENADFNI